MFWRIVSAAGRRAQTRRRSRCRLRNRWGPAHCSTRAAPSMTQLLRARETINHRLFKAVHRRNLIYNTCWEDPALDRVALELGPSDRVMVITSAGCNALDYLLAGAGEV